MDRRALCLFVQPSLVACQGAQERSRAPQGLGTPALTPLVFFCWLSKRAQFQTVLSTRSFSYNSDVLLLGLDAGHVVEMVAKGCSFLALLQCLTSCQDKSFF